MSSQLLTYTNPESYKVLVVDDNPVNLRMITDYLGHEIGFHVLTAKNGSSGLQRARHGHPDIILLDVLMPGIDGFETCHELKQLAETKDIPIIFMTALSETEDKVKGFEAGAVDFITKPIQQEEVLARVVTHLRIYDLTHHLEMLVETRTHELQESLAREQLLAEQLRQSLAKETELNALKTQMIEAISHEFRTPMTVITQAISLFQHHLEKMSDEQRESQFKKANDSISFIHELIQDASLVANIDPLPAHAASISWADLIAGLREDLASEFNDSPRLIVTGGPGSGMIKTDTHWVKQIVGQLVNNALKFSDEAEPVNVRILQDTDENKIIVLVEDNGIGIPAAEQEMVFDLFTRASNVEARRGLGLGLYMAQNLVQKINGRIAIIQSKENQGSIFCLQFPQEI